MWLVNYPPFVCTSWCLHRARMCMKTIMNQSRITKTHHTTAATQSAWFDQQAVTPALVNAYRLPQLVKGWEAGMLRFLYARLSILAPVMRGAAPPAEGDATQVARFASTVASAGIPVLLLHGEADALVPLRNSQALAAVVPGATLTVLPRCGHVPQEEVPACVAAEVASFLKSKGVGTVEGRV